MGFRSFYFVRRHTVKSFVSKQSRNSGPALISQDRLAVTKIVFSSAVSAVVNSNSFVACSGLF